MFGDDDEDFIIDEDFLKEAFQTPAACKPVDTTAASEIRASEKRRSNESDETNLVGLVKKKKNDDVKVIPSKPQFELSADIINEIASLEQSLLLDEELLSSQQLRETVARKTAPIPDVPSISLKGPPDSPLDRPTPSFSGSTSRIVLDPPAIPLNSSSVSLKRFLPNSSLNRSAHLGGNPAQSSLKLTPVRPPQRAKRKFPGPAGLLPELDRSVASSDSKELERDIAGEIPRGPPVPLSSQSASQATSSSAWQEATRVLDVQLGDPRCPLGRFTVAWVRQMAAARRLPQHKVPFALVAVRSLDPSSTDPSVVLQDPSGEMSGILHQELWAEYSPQLMPGSVLALRQVGVLSTGSFARHQCLNITANNVIAIFTPQSSQGSYTTHVRPISREKLLEEAEFTPCAPSAPPTPQSRSALFPTVGTPTLSLSGGRKQLEGAASPASSLSSVRTFSPQLCSTPKGPALPVSQNKPQPGSDNNANSARVSNFFAPRSAAPPAKPGQPVNSQILQKNVSVSKPATPSSSTWQKCSEHPTSTGFNPRRPSTPQNTQPSGSSNPPPAPSCPQANPSGESRDSITQPDLHNLLDGLDADALFGDF